MADNNLKKVTEQRFSFIDVNDISYWGNFHEHFSGWDPKTPVLYHIEGSAGSSENTGETTTTYTLTFKTQFGAVIKEMKKVEEGDYVSYPQAPEVAGYTFSAWSQDITVMPAKNTIITAIYEANVYTLTYIIDDVEYTKEIAYQQPIVVDDPTKEHYVFIGWEGMPADKKMPIDGVTITAKFEGESHTITLTYKDANGLETTKGVDVKYGDLVSDYIQDVDNTEDAEYKYTFTGWDPSFDENTLVEGDVTYVAQYDEIKKEYTIEYNIVSGNTIIPFTSIKNVWGTEVSVELPTEAGYEFSAWEPVYDAIQVGNVSASTKQTAKVVIIKVDGEDKEITCDSPVSLDADKLNIAGYDAEYVLSPESAAAIIDGQVVMTPEQIENAPEGVEVTISTSAKTVTVEILGEDVTMTCKSDDVVFEMPTKAGYDVSLNNTIGTLTNTEDGRIQFTLTPEEVEAILNGNDAVVSKIETPKVITVKLEGKDDVTITCEGPVSLGEPNHVAGYVESWETENGTIDEDNNLHLSADEIEALGDIREINVTVKSDLKVVSVPVGDSGESVNVTCENAATLDEIVPEAGYTIVYAVSPEGAATVENGVLSMTGEQIDNMPENIEVVINRTPNVLVINVDGENRDFTVEDSYVYPTSAETGYERVNKVNDEVVTDDKFELSGEAIDDAIANGTEFVITTSMEPLMRTVKVVDGEIIIASGTGYTDEKIVLDYENREDEGWRMNWGDINPNEYPVVPTDNEEIIIEGPMYEKIPVTIHIEIDNNFDVMDGSEIVTAITTPWGKEFDVFSIYKPVDIDGYKFIWDSDLEMNNGIVVPSFRTEPYEIYGAYEEIPEATTIYYNVLRNSEFTDNLVNNMIIDVSMLSGGTIEVDELGVELKSLKVLSFTPTQEEINMYNDTELEDNEWYVAGNHTVVVFAVPKDFRFNTIKDGEEGTNMKSFETISTGYTINGSDYDLVSYTKNDMKYTITEAKLNYNYMVNINE